MDASWKAVQAPPLEERRFSTTDKHPSDKRETLRSEGKLSQRSHVTSISKNDSAALQKYRMFKIMDQPARLLAEQCMCRLSTNRERSCPCQTRGSLCVQSMKWVALVYDTKEAGKLPGLYDNYRRNTKLDLTMLEGQIARDIDEILVAWGLTIKRVPVVEMLLNFAKHCTYYRRPAYLKIYGWLAVALLYHCQPYQAFWLLDSITDELSFQSKLEENIQYVYRLLNAYFKDKVADLVLAAPTQEAQGVHFREVVGYLLQDLLCSYIPIDLVGYSLECMLLKGWRHLHQLLLSYIDKRLEVMEKTCPSSSQLSYICLLNNDTQWPLIFFNMESFKKLELSPANTAQDITPFAT